jgi:hypothetical protein
MGGGIHRFVLVTTWRFGGRSRRHADCVRQYRWEGRVDGRVRRVDGCCGFGGARIEIFEILRNGRASGRSHRQNGPPLSR